MGEESAEDEGTSGEPPSPACIPPHPPGPICNIPKFARTTCTAYLADELLNWEGLHESCVVSLGEFIEVGVCEPTQVGWCTEVIDGEVQSVTYHYPGSNAVGGEGSCLTAGFEWTWCE